MTKLSADDRLALFDLHARFYVAIDEKDEAMFMGCWAEDDDIAIESAFGSPRGLEQMHQFFHIHINGHAMGKRHILQNLIIRESDDPDIAYATSYMIVLEVEDLPRVHASAILRDTKCARTAGGWRFRLRSMEFDPGYGKWMALHPEAMPQGQSQHQAG
jgi:hypothetical protein